MTIHKNARPNPHIRGLIVSRVPEQNLSPRRLVEELAWMLGFGCDLRLHHG